MSDRALKGAGAASRGDGDAGMDARGRAMHARAGMTAVEQRREQLPRAIAEDAVRAARVRRNAWLLGGLAVFFYLGYMAWMFFRASGG
jgi:hypothetical protein